MAYTFDVIDGTKPGDRVARLSCAHGWTGFDLWPGQLPSVSVLRDLTERHVRTHGCSCVARLRCQDGPARVAAGAGSRR